jgi:hypothetical protein
MFFTTAPWILQRFDKTGSVEEEAARAPRIMAKNAIQAAAFSTSVLLF